MEGSEEKPLSFCLKPEGGGHACHPLCLGGTVPGPALH